MRATVALAQSPLFQEPIEELPFFQSIKLSYTRVKAIADLYSELDAVELRIGNFWLLTGRRPELTASDILHFSPRYWELLTDPILSMDGSVVTLLAIQYNLCIGTLVNFVESRPDIEKVISEALDYRILIQFCLTEIDHGLNAINIETSATLQVNGEFLLHTPHSGATKYMPSTCPLGIPSLAIVFARLVVNGEDYGIRPFLVKLHDGFKMDPGITSRQVKEGTVSMLLPPRGTSRPIGHSLASFNQVRLPSSALLGKLEKPHNIRECFFESIQRVVGGTLSMGAWAISSLRLGCYIAAAYSLRREVLDASTQVMRPISSFSTQYIPLLSSIARTLVFLAWSQDVYERFVDQNISHTQKHFITSVFKTTIFRHTPEILLQLGDRCGAQGLFSVNQLFVLHTESRGAAIAEGDILGFAIDTLRGKVKIYKPKFPDHLLAKHEDFVVSELRRFLAQNSDHRGAETERMLLPQCCGVLESIGHRWAYEAALARGVSQPIIELFVASLFDLDAAWYAENCGITRWKQKTLLVERATALYEDLPQLLKLLDVENYITAPIVSKERWERYTLELPCYTTEPKRLTQIKSILYNPHA
ncbi:hypothetical protein Clacol_000194 [Clathrus columnatus]|uniref:Acyl-coenzyme A oxidase n=1 Tax=Clathrus columnatus TaxID=1419009 RepID=A0AAV4ZXZ4_9AGAM|nr:hypothetical protein Clacol_000194 [Clathrus columnatus]